MAMLGGSPLCVVVLQTIVKYENFLKKRGETHSLSLLAKVGRLGQTAKSLCSWH